MSVKSAKQYGLMAGVAHGSIMGSGVPKATAEEFVHKTPASKRKAFAKNLKKHKKQEKV